MSELKFHAIKKFVTDLGEMYSSDNHALALYDRLLQKTSIAHTEAVEKHISAFTDFYSKNADVILNLGTEFTSTIQYSPKVFIDMTEVFRLVGADKETKVAIHKHLLFIAMLLDTACGVKEKLKEKLKEITKAGSDAGSIIPSLLPGTGSQSTADPSIKFDGGTNEDDYLNDIIGKVEKAIGNNADDQMSATDAFGKVMGTGIVNEIIAGIGSKAASGTLDIGKMVSSVQKMVGKLAGDADASDPQMSQMMGMINMLQGSMPTKF